MQKNDIDENSTDIKNMCEALITRSFLGEIWGYWFDQFFWNIHDDIKITFEEKILSLIRIIETDEIETIHCRSLCLDHGIIFDDYDDKLYELHFNCTKYHICVEGGSQSEIIGILKWILKMHEKYN